MKSRTFDRLKNGVECLLAYATLIGIKLSEVSNSFVSGNVPDIIYPITNYTFARATFLEKPSLPLTLGITALGTAAEFAQYYGIYPGTFDPIDIPMYFVGAGFAYGIDQLTFNHKKSGLEGRL